MSLLNPNLEAFLAITKVKTVHGAANELRLTQTAVTQRIRTLEGSLSTTLFTRSRRGMMLTPEGEVLLRYCQSVRELEGETLAKIQGNGSQFESRITITGPTSIMRSRVIPKTSKLLKKFSSILLTFHINDFDNWLDQVRTNDAQLAIVPRDIVPKEMDSKLLKPESFVLVGPKPWGRRSTQEIIQNERIIDFDQNDPMTFNYLKKYNFLRFAKRQRHFVNNTESLMELISEGYGYGVLALEFLEAFEKSGKYALLNEGKKLDHQMAACWYPRPQPPEYFKAIVQGLA